MNNLYMLVGLPGSGKSEYAKELAKKCNAKIFSSDAIREEYENATNETVFKILHKRLLEHLKDGNAIYDATNISAKRRKEFLKSVKIECRKTCIIVATSFMECLKNNKERDEPVPEYVIENMYKNWNTPWFFEGWDCIKIHYNTKPRKSLRTLWKKCKEFDQQNVHHSKTLGDHMQSAAKLMVEKYGQKKLSLVLATLFHDIGKIKTKQIDAVTGYAHYYQHHCVGAYDIMFYRFLPCKLYVSTLINYHMYPYFWKKQSTFDKYRKIWGDELYDDIIKLHLCDAEAH